MIGRYWTYINTCLCLCVCVPSVASKKMTVNLYWGSHRAKTRDVFPNYPIRDLPSRGERDKITHSCHTHALCHTMRYGIRHFGRLCWLLGMESMSGLECSLIRWRWFFSTLRFSSKRSWKCEMFQWEWPVGWFFNVRSKRRFATDDYQGSIPK